MSRDVGGLETAIPNRLRRLRFEDIFDWRSLLLWVLPLWATIATLAIIQDLAGDNVRSTGIGGLLLDGRGVLYPYYSHVFVALFSTLCYAVWAQFLRLRGVRHAELYAVAARCFQEFCGGCRSRSSGTR